MIDKKAIEQFVEKELDGTQYFLVGVNVTGANEIKIDIDSFESVDIDFCVSLTADDSVHGRLFVRRHHFRR